jgi:hypothetical protein
MDDDDRLLSADGLLLVRGVAPRAFLTAADVPPNLLRLKPGDWVEVLRRRTVVRVGYRLRADEVRSEAEAPLNAGGEAWELRRAFCRWLRPADPTAFLTAKEFADLSWLVARRMVSARRFGGPDRGAVVEEHPPSLVERGGATYPPEVAQVHSTRVVRLGKRYGPCGSGDDYEDGGLESPRSVVLVRLSYAWCPERFSGDVRRCAAPVEP